MIIRDSSEASIILRHARELGLRQPVFVGTASVDNALIANDGYAAEGVIGAWPLPIPTNPTRWLELNPIRPRVVQISLNVYAYGDT